MLSLEEIEKLNLDNVDDYNFLHDQLEECIKNNSTLSLQEMKSFIAMYIKYESFKRNLDLGVEWATFKDRALASASTTYKKIYINNDVFNETKLDARNLFSMSYSSVPSCLFLLNHELRHIKQGLDMSVDFKENSQEFGKISPNTLLMAKEKVGYVFYDDFADNYQNTIIGDAYLDNYQNSLLENDANYFGFIDTYNFLYEFNKELADAFYDKNFKEFARNIKLIQNSYATRQKDVESNAQSNDMIAQYKFSLITDFVIKNNLNLFEELPILHFVYNDLGEKRRYQEILKIAKSLKESCASIEYNAIYLGKEVSLQENFEDIINYAIASDPILLYDKSLYEIRTSKNFDKSEFDKIINRFNHLANELDGRFFEDFKKLTQSELSLLNNDYNLYKRQNDEISADLTANKIHLIRNCFDNILEKNEQFSEKVQNLKNERKNDIDMLNRAFGINVEKVDIKITDDSMFGKNRYDKEALLEMLKEKSDELLDDEKNALLDAINRLRPQTLNSLKHEENNDYNNQKNDDLAKA